jgi:ornithine cyclodeaminase
MNIAFFDEEAIDAALDFHLLVAELRTAFAGSYTVPVRHHHAIEHPGKSEATHLLMPAWTEGATPESLGVKIVNVFPDNSRTGLPSVQGLYVLMSGETGQPLAVMDGARLTAWRTACASALAASFLAAPDARHLVMVGTGALSPFVIRAHAAMRPIDTVTIWGRDPDKARDIADELDEDAFAVGIAENLEQAVGEADIVSCATLSQTALVQGAWLKPGAHLDLIGAYRPTMRESDDEAVRRARLFVDTRGGALKEGGDIVIPLEQGVITADKIEADLFDLCRGTVSFQRNPQDITLFKSTGTAIEDLAAAALVWRKSGRG